MQNTETVKDALYAAQSALGSQIEGCVSEGCSSDKPCSYCLEAQSAIEGLDAVLNSMIKAPNGQPHFVTPQPETAVLAIQELMDGVEWSATTLDEIAQVLINAGYRVRDLEDKDIESEVLERGSFLSTEGSHAADCASRFHSAAECTCGEAERQAKEGA